MQMAEGLLKGLESYHVNQNAMSEYMSKGHEISISERATLQSSLKHFSELPR